MREQRDARPPQQQGGISQQADDTSPQRYELLRACGTSGGAQLPRLGGATTAGGDQPLLGYWDQPGDSHPLSTADSATL